MSERKAAFLRGINVGKAKRIAMADLRELFESLGYTEVRTLLNSGNVVYTTSGSPLALGRTLRARSGRTADAQEGARIERAIAGQLGVTTRVTILTSRELATAVEKNPMRSIADDPSRLLLLVAREPKTLALARPLLKERWAPEALALQKRIAYMWCAKGLLDSRLWAAVNKAVGDDGTSRNIATMTKLMEMMKGD